MKYMLLFILISMQINVSAQLTDTINWRANYKLKWEDFKGEPDSNSINGAISSCSITYSYSYENNKFRCNVVCYFLKKYSWSKRKVKGSILLVHEQGHFNIAEIFARKLRQAIKNYTYNASTINQDLEHIYRQIDKEYDDFNNLYDQQTESSTNQPLQLLWSKKILAEINKLKDYKD